MHSMLCNIECISETYIEIVNKEIRNKTILQDHCHLFIKRKDKLMIT